MDDDLLQHLMLITKKVARAIEANVECKKVGVIVAGLEVPHAHIHLVPIQGISDINFANANPAIPEDLNELAEKIRATLA